MPFRELSNRAASRIIAALDQEVDDERRTLITQTVEQAIVDAIVAEHARCTELAVTACAADEDLAHKISREIRRASRAVVANLTSMR